jgi:antitoxin (DNA-binding transcriptional repressor) of toxin-antitoxin stability system
MRTMTATEIARGFSHLLDSLEHGGDEIVILRKGRVVARLVPVPAQMTMREAMADIYGTLDEAEGRAWLADMAKGRFHRRRGRSK